jgi:DNA-binding IclR family transcriptional regulator
MQNKSNTTSIEKALNVLNAFLPYNDAVSTTELSQKLGLHIATVSRILLTLAKNGYLRQDSQTKKYMLGPTVLKLGNSVIRSLQSNLVPIAKPYIDTLRDTLGETVTFEIFSGTYSYMAYVAGTANPVRVAAEVGETLPSHAAAGSKSILAFLPQDVVAQSLKRDVLRAYTPNTITDEAEFYRYLHKVRQRGYATDFGEIDVGVNAIAVPVFDHQEQAMGAVVVVGPSARIPGENLDFLVSRLTGTASRISGLMHYAGDFYQNRVQASA